MTALTEQESEYARRSMVEHQIRTWDVLDATILNLMERMPRERFVPDAYRSLAYADIEIPLGDGQAMMTPKVEGRLLQSLDIKPSDSILEIGTGSGFLAACLATLGANVTSCEIRDAFLPGARRGLESLGLDEKVELLHQDSARLDWTDQRFDVICVTGSMPIIDPDFASHLAIGGRMFLIFGSAPVMEALVISRVSEDEWARESLFETVLAPLDNVAVPSPFRF